MDHFFDAGAVDQRDIEVGFLRLGNELRIFQSALQRAHTANFTAGLRNAC